RSIEESTRELETGVSKTEEVDRKLVDAPVEHLCLAWAANFHLRAATVELVRFAGTRIRDDEAPGPSSLLISKFRGGLRRAPIRITSEQELTDPSAEGFRFPALAVPLTRAGRLTAVVLYGAHTGGDDIDEEEREALSEFAHAASIAHQGIQIHLLNDGMET